MTITETTPTRREPSLLRFRRSVGRDLLSKTLDFAEFADGVRTDRAYGYRVQLTHRSRGQALARTDFGEERWVIDGTSNDYLGLAADDRVVAAVVAEVQRYGVGAQGAGMLNGNSPLHAELERELGDFLGFEAVMLVPSGFGAMQGTCQALLTPTDAVFADKYCHSSIEAGLRLGGGRIYRYPHRDIDALERLLADHRNKHRGALIVTDGVFSTEGSVADVPALIELARRFECRLMVDDAHGIGVVGERGEGCGALAGVDILGGTLSKAFGSGGGFIAADRATIEYLRLFGVSACTTTNLSIANAAGALAALRVMRSEPERRRHLASLVQNVRSGLREQGMDVADHPTPIINLPIGRDSETYLQWRELYDEGVLTHALPFPIVPRGMAAIRLRLTHSMPLELTNRIIEHVGEAFSKRAPQPTPSPTRTKAEPAPSAPVISTMVDTSIGRLAVHQRPGSGPNVLLLHPLLFDSSSWAAVVDLLPGDTDITMIDAPGHGRSGPSEREAGQLTLDDVAAATLEAMAAVEKANGAVVVGSSMGGMAAMRIAALDPSAISGLVLVGTSAEAEEGPNREVFEPLVDVARSIGPAALAEDVATFMFSTSFFEQSPRSVARVLEGLTALDPDAVAPVVDAVLNRRDITHELESVAVPTAIIVGDEDVAEPPPHSEALGHLIASSTVEVVPGCGHLVQLEQASVVVDAIRDVSERSKVDAVA